MTSLDHSVLHGDIRARIDQVARTWLDVPVQHRGRNRFGIDCIGFIGLTGIEAGALEGPLDRIDDGTAYRRLPDPDQLIAWLGRFLVPIGGPAAEAKAQAGDVVALSWGAAGSPAHLAILSTLQGQPGARRTIIHALPLVDPPRVREQGFAAEWPRRVCSFWRFPLAEV